MEVENIKKQFLALIHVFMCKSAHCIFNCRCPDKVKNIIEDNDTKWCDFKLPKSQSIIRKVSSNISHGWIKINVILTNPKTIQNRKAEYMIRMHTNYFGMYQ